MIVGSKSKRMGEVEIQTLKSIPLSERVPMLPGG